MAFSTGRNLDFQEAMRIDSSGNLLVGKTSSNFLTVGNELLENGSAFHVRDGGAPLYLDRKTSDGNIVNFAKDGTTVGSMGARNADNM